MERQCGALVLEDQPRLIHQLRHQILEALSDLDGSVADRLVLDAQGMGSKATHGACTLGAVVTAVADPADPSAGGEVVDGAPGDERDVDARRDGQSAKCPPGRGDDGRTPGVLDHPREGSIEIARDQPAIRGERPPGSSDDVLGRGDREIRSQREPLHLPRPVAPACRHRARRPA